MTERRFILYRRSVPINVVGQNEMTTLLPIFSDYKEPIKSEREIPANSYEDEADAKARENCKYIVFKEGHAENTGSVIELGLKEETQVAVVGRRELIGLLPVLNDHEDYKYPNKFERHLPRGWIFDVTDAHYARKLGRDLAKKEAI